MVHNFYFYDVSITSSLIFSFDDVDVDLDLVLTDLDTVLYLTLNSRKSFVITKTYLNDKPLVNIVINISGEGFHQAVNICDNFLSLRGLEKVV